MVQLPMITVTMGLSQLSPLGLDRLPMIPIGLGQLPMIEVAISLGRLPMIAIALSGQLLTLRQLSP